MLLIQKSLVLSINVLFLLSINANYAVYHVFMSKKKEFNTRLLNKLYSQMAVWAQVGSVVNLLLVLKSLDFWTMPYIDTVKHLQLPCMVYSFLAISIATNIKIYKGDMYLDLGHQLSYHHLLWSMPMFRLLVSRKLLIPKLISPYYSLISYLLTLSICSFQTNENCLDEGLNIINRIIGILSVVLFSLHWLVFFYAAIKV